MDGAADTVTAGGAVTVGDAVAVLAGLTARFWDWRASRAPRTRDDIPRVVRPAGWRPAWDAATVAADLAFVADIERGLATVGADDDPAVETPRRLLASATARVRWELEILASWRTDPWFYLDQTLGHIFDALLAPGPFSARRAGELLERLGWIPETLAVARANLATTAAREFAQLALDDSARAPEQLREAMTMLAPALPEMLRLRTARATERAATALAEWRSWLSDQLPVLPPHRPVGPDGFAFYLHRVALLPWSAAEILALGARERERAEALELFELVRSGPVDWPAPPESAAEQCDREREAELAVRAFYAERGLLSQPQTLRHYRNLPLPDHLAPLRWLGVTDDLTDENRLDSDGVSYVPPPAADLPYFYRANAVDPRAGVIHEGAHYQQLARTWRHPDPAHRRYYDSVSNEGIAFYNEEMLLRAGLFDDAPVTRAIVHNFMRLRAIRVEVDVRLALGEVDIDGAALMLRDLVPMDAHTARQEAALFASTPGLGLSYQVGKSLVLRLLADAARRDGDRFDPRAFHDALWDDGNIPLSVYRLRLLGDPGDLVAADRLAGSASLPAPPDAPARDAPAADTTTTGGAGTGSRDTGVATPAAADPVAAEPVPDTGDDMRRLAARLLHAITAGDVDAVADLYADDVRVWHNHDGIERDRTESLDAVRAIATRYDGFHATDVRVDALPDGYAQRCVFRGRDRVTGADLAAHAMMRVLVRDGRVVRVEEYTDPAQGTVPGPASPGEGPEGDLTDLDGAGGVVLRRLRDGTGWERQAGYSRAARVGNLIAVSGTTAHGPDGAALYPGDTYEQATECLFRAVAAVRRLGGSRAWILRTRMLLAPEADWREAARAHAEVLGDVAPANSTYTTGALIGPGFLVEVEVDAVAAGG